MQNTKFSYDPESLINQGIIVRNFPWEDMTAPTFDVVLKAVKFMHKIIGLGSKILVHCHAGRGRTAIVVASYFIYAESKTADEAIALIKAKRKECLTKKCQRDFLVKFQFYIRERQIIFKENGLVAKSLEQLLSAQKIILYGNEKKKLLYCPKLVEIICRRITDLVESNSSIVNNFTESIIGTLESNEDSIRNLKACINSWNWNCLYNSIDFYSLVQLLFDFLEGLQYPVMNSIICSEIVKIEENKIVVANYDKVKSTEIGEIIKRLAYIVHIINPSEAIFTKIIYRIGIAVLGLRLSEAECFNKRMLISTSLKAQVIMDNFYAIFSYQINLNAVEGFAFTKAKANSPSPNAKTKEDQLLDQCEEFIKLNEIDDEKTRLIKEKFKLLVQEISAAK